MGGRSLVNRAALLLLLAALVSVGPAQVTVPAVSGSPRPGLPVETRLERFKVLNADEDAWYSDGDEPYLWVLYFKVDGATVDLQNLAAASASVYSPHREIRDHRTGKTTRVGSHHGNLGRSGVDAGADFAISPLLGVYTTSLTPIRGLAEDLARRATLLGVIVVAMEEDSSSEFTAEAGRREFERAMTEELNAAVRSLNPNVDARAIADRVSGRVVAKMREETLRGWPEIFRFLASVADPDDFIGADFRHTTYDRLERAGAVPFRMDFAKSGVHYQITGVFQRR